MIMMSTPLRRAVLAAALSIPVFAASACGGAGEMGGMGHEPAARSASAGSSGTPVAPVNPADLMFVQMMIPHHQQAVQMSDLLLAKSGVDPDVRKLAEQIKAAQQPEIDQMQGWLDDWDVSDASTAGTDHSDHMGGLLTSDQLDALEDADGPTGQKLFLEGMIAHHEGAIQMADNVLGVGQDPRVKTLAETIARTQQAEITEMREMLRR